MLQVMHEPMKSKYERLASLYRPVSPKEIKEELGLSEDYTHKFLNDLQKKKYAIKVERGRYILINLRKWAILRLLFEEDKYKPVVNYVLKKFGQWINSIEEVILYGSRVRGEETKKSDYDILLITDNPNVLEYKQKHCKSKKYSIMVLSRDFIMHKPRLITYSILKEGESLFDLNYCSLLLESVRIDKSVLKKEVNTIKKDLERFKRNLKSEYDFTAPISYGSILHFRTLYLIELFYEGKSYSKHGFLRRVKGFLDGGTLNKAYNIYDEVRHKGKSDKELDERTLKELLKGFGEYKEFIVSSFFSS